MKNRIKRIITRAILPKDYSDYFGCMILKKFKDDFLYNKDTSLKEKIWCYKRGFTSEKIEMFGLNEENYEKYISDFDYYRIHPINKNYSKWIDDKLTTAYILKPFKEFLPKYYFQLEIGGILKLDDCYDEIENSIEGIIDLLKKEGHLAAKLLSGTQGVGFYKFSCINDQLYINGKNVTYKEMLNLIGSLDNYLIMEYLYSHQDLNTIFNKTLNTMRIITVYDDTDGPQITRGFMRFGSNSSGFVDNISAGGVFANIDIDTGKFFEGRIVDDCKIVPCYNHPDTGVKVEGYLPNWEYMKKTLIEICNYIPQLKYMGWDIVITDDGFKIVEINSHPELNYTQCYLPMYENKYNKNLFNKILK